MSVCGVWFMVCGVGPGSAVCGVWSAASGVRCLTLNVTGEPDRLFIVRSEDRLREKIRSGRRLWSRTLLLNARSKVRDGPLPTLPRE